MNSFLVFGYLGPETFLPATSVIATIIGVVLMVGKNGMRWMLGGVARIWSRRASTSVILRGPHAKAESRKTVDSPRR